MSTQTPDVMVSKLPLFLSNKPFVHVRNHLNDERFRVSLSVKFISDLGLNVEILRGQKYIDFINQLKTKRKGKNTNHNTGNSGIVSSYDIYSRDGSVPELNFLLPNITRTEIIKNDFSTCIEVDENRYNILQIQKFHFPKIEKQKKLENLTEGTSILLLMKKYKGKKIPLIFFSSYQFGSLKDFMAEYNKWFMSYDD